MEHVVTHTNGLKTVNVFVYGTLLPGYSNHRLVEDLVHSVTAGVVGGFRLLDVGSFPGARPAPAFGVRGDILTLKEPEEALYRLDALEGVPRLYTREWVTVETDAGTKVGAWMYVLSPSVAKRSTPLTETEGGADSWRHHKAPHAYWNETTGEDEYVA